jgi:hypothetical protein
MRVGKGSRLHKQGTRKWTGLASVAALAVGILGGAQAARGQAMPTASQGSNLSVFVGATGTYTGLDYTAPNQGRNLGITAGGDYTIGGFFGFRPAVEVRGTYPIYDGGLDDQKSILAGVRVERPIRRFHPYGDFLIGRGEINYIGLVVVGFQEYIRTDSTVYSPGAGFEYDLTHHFALRVDAQDQHWDTPVNPSGSAWAKQGTVAATYRFDFNHHWKQRRQR